MGISNITENITRSTALQHETFTTQFHQLLQNNQGNTNDLGNKTSLWGEWSFPGECKPAFLDDEMLSIQLFITLCSLMYIHDMQFLALWTTMAAPKGSMPLTVASTKTNLVGSWTILNVQLSPKPSESYLDVPLGSRSPSNRTAYWEEGNNRVK